MNIAIIGTGYVGLVTGACFARTGVHVTCFDKDPHKIERLNNATAPFHEPDLDALIYEGLENGLLEFHSSLDAIPNFNNIDAIFLAMGTPTAANGRTQLTDLLNCVHHLAKILTRHTLVVIKSTVPVGTCQQVQEILTRHSAPGDFPPIVASNPEFLAEGRAVADFQNPERIVIGCDEPAASALLKTLYHPFDPDGDRTLLMGVRSSEYAKYACNAMLAARLSMVNELACIAQRLHVDMRSVGRVLRSDPRIGPHYLQPGAGFGGSCLPKDLKALMTMARDSDEPAYMLHSVETVNENQSKRLLDTVLSSLSYDLQGRHIAIWGLSFKAGTDDLREAPSIRLAYALLDAGAVVQAYDPIAADAAQRLITNPKFVSCADPYSACQNADALVVMTDWQEFRHPDFDKLAKNLNSTIIVDAQQLYEASQLRHHGLLHMEIGQQPLLSDPFTPSLLKQAM